MSREGVIKFSSEHETGPLDAPARAAAESLLGWRNLLFRAGLIGLDPDRYDGVGYGNVSVRIDASSFVVSGTQTSPIERVGPEHFVRIDGWEVAQNRVVSRGELRPSSETMTHAMIYSLDASVDCVLHVHSPEIFAAHTALGLATTPPDAGYGTPEMAAAVSELYVSGALEHGAFAMLGHEDGVVVFGPTVDAAGEKLMKLFAGALGAD